MPRPYRLAQPGPAAETLSIPAERAHSGRRHRLGAVLLSVAALVIAGSLGYALSRPAQAAPPPSRSAGPPGRGLAIRKLAAAWVAGQVSRTVIVSCDPVMCGALEARGIPAGDLLELRTGRADPLRSDVIVATAAVRRLLGSRLRSVYAPAMIASFGKGAERIDIRVIAKHGAAAYESALSADLLERKESAAGLLSTDRIAVSAAARKQLSAGYVDPRLLVTIAGFAALHPVDIVAFGDQAPGAGPAASPLRSVELAAAPGVPGIAGSAFVRSLLSFLRVQRAPYAPASEQAVRLAGGQTAVRIEFSAPSRLGLLNGSNAGQLGTWSRSHHQRRVYQRRVITLAVISAAASEAR
jgi:hypothetical protein